MEKYKLIKKYPGSPELGTIVEARDNLFEKLILNHPEFWEKVIEKDYEILEIKGYSGHYFLQKDGSFKYRGEIYGNEQTNCYADKYLKSNFPHHIHSVKRLSDGEIFTISDKVDSTISDLGRFTNLTGFKLNNNKILFGLRNLGYYPLNTIIKYKKPLFTTEDGVDVYEGDKFYWVKIKNSRSIDSLWKISSIIDKMNFIYEPQYEKYFSTKEKAEEYILMNKPCLSIQEVMKVYSWDQIVKAKNALIDIVKSKLK